MPGGPERIGIILSGGRSFNQPAFTYLITHLNCIQRLFEFELLPSDIDEELLASLASSAVVDRQAVKELARSFDSRYKGATSEITAEMEDTLLRVIAEYEGRPFPRTAHLVGKWLSGRLRYEASEQAVYCAELLAITFTRMGLLDPHTPANWFDPGKFWSGDRLDLTGGAALGPEIAVTTA